MDELYQYGGVDEGVENFMNTQQADILKAMIAGDKAGHEYIDQVTGGPGLKVESLDPTVKILTNRDKHIVFWKELPKRPVYNTVNEYNQLLAYGQDIGLFNLEGETPGFTDSQYKRESSMVKYMGVSGEVTHPSMLVKVADGKNMLTREVENKTMLLLRLLNQNLSIADSSKIAVEFDGVFRSHFAGVTNKTYSLDTYWGDSTVVDARGRILNDSMVQSAAHAVVNDNFGEISAIMAPPVVFKNYVQQYQSQKRFLVGQEGAIVGATTGQSVQSIQTQFGPVAMKHDIFFDRKQAKLYNAAANNAKSPASPVLDGSTPIAVVTDTKTQFGSGSFNGNYFYAISAKNRYGESALVPVNTTTQAVSASQSVDLKFTDGAGTYPTECFVIYRTELNAADYTVANYWPILTVSVTELAAGWDGAAAGLVRDRNRNIPNTYSAIVYDNTEDIWDYMQLAPTMRMDLAITSPSRRFMILNYGAFTLYAPKKLAVIKNIGNIVPTA